MTAAQIDQLLEKVEDALDSIRPFLNSDGGDIEVVGIRDDDVLEVNLLGACKTCKMSFTTMKAGVEASVIKAVPQIKEIIVVNRLEQ
ncbi:MAG: NifU family protein [Bacteroidetes bacterium]|nr:NifU family protein [Bacteroidota bacterium]